MVRAGIPLDRVNPVFVTHHHYDHIGDLADVMLTSWLMGRQHDLQVLGPPGTTSIVNALLTQVYDKDIEFRDKGEPAIVGGWKPVVGTDILSGLVYDSGTWQVYAEIAKHGHDLQLPDAFKHRWVCLGYRLEAEGKVVVISGDGVASDGLDRLAQDADVLVQCCYLATAELTTPTLQNLAKHTLACSDTVGKIAQKARVKKQVLTIYDRSRRPCLPMWLPMWRAIMMDRSCLGKISWMCRCSHVNCDPLTESANQHRITSLKTRKSES
ncbi:MBL fold metallo-hydrolase [Candidatus Entotheonella serta]|nr:MBL fold metallo-hydrolase [Candidatus Entotheonella serta]